MQTVDDIKKEVVLRYVEQLQKEFSLSPEQVVSLIQENSAGFVPVDIFTTRELSGLQALVTYLKEKKEYRFRKIGEMIGRDQRTIWTAYNQSKKRLKESFVVPQTTGFIPVGRFRNRKFSILENVVTYLKEQNYSNKDISRLLNRKETTVSTAISRALRKKCDAL